MKVTTCLNPLHTALAVYGCVLGFDSIASEMSCPELKKLVYGIGEEGMKVVVNPGINKYSPKVFETSLIILAISILFFYLLRISVFELSL